MSEDLMSDKLLVCRWIRKPKAVSHIELCHYQRLCAFILALLTAKLAPRRIYLSLFISYEKSVCTQY